MLRNYQLYDTVTLNHLMLANLKNIEIAVDMTVGNGHDTLFLAQHFPKVIGFDLQPQAIANVQNKCVFKNVTLYCADHYYVADYLDYADLFLFNLGWLPGSDKTILTTAEHTVATLEKCQGLLRKGGLISIVCYRGSAEQRAENAAIAAWIESNNAFCVQVVQMLKNTKAPVLYLLALEKSVDRGII